MGILGIVLLLATAGCEGMFMEQTKEPVPQKTEMQKQAPQQQCLCVPTPGQRGGLVSMNEAPAPQPVQGRCIFCIPTQLPINPYTELDNPFQYPSSNMQNLPFLPKYFHPSPSYQGILPTEFAGPQNFLSFNPSYPEWSQNPPGLMPGLSEGPTNISPGLSLNSFFPSGPPNYQGPPSYPSGYSPNFSVDSPDSIQPLPPRQPTDFELRNPSQPSLPYGPYNQPCGPPNYFIGPHSGPPPYPFQLNSLPLGPRPTVYCPTILQNLCGTPVRLNSLTPMCPPGTLSTSYQPSNSRPNEICPPVLNSMSRPLFGSHVNFGNPMSQLANQIKSTTNSQSSEDSRVGDQYAGFSPQHQRHSTPSNPSAIPTVVRSLNDW